MKKILFLIAIFCSVACQAQDVIVKKDGSTILAIVTKVGENEIEYKKFNSTSDRKYSISTANVMTINYEDGEKEDFNSTKNQGVPNDNTVRNNVPVFVNLSPNENNAALIKKHNPDVQFAKQPNKKKCSIFFPNNGCI